MQAQVVAIRFRVIHKNRWSYRNLSNTWKCLPKKKRVILGNKNYLLNFQCKTCHSSNFQFVGFVIKDYL